MNRMLHIFRAAAVALAIGSFACGGQHPVDPKEHVQCQADTACPGAQVCVEHLCTVVETRPRELGFILVPPKGSSYPPQTVPVSPIDVRESVTIGAAPGVRVAGAIELVGVTGEANGQLKFKQRGSENAFAGETRVERNEYELFVPAGRYDVTFFPDDATLATRLGRDVPLELDTDPKLRFNAETVRISGTLSRTHALTQESSRVESARVFAVSRDTGSVTSTAITDESGDFTIHALHDSGTYDLHVGPAEPNRFDPARSASFVPDVSFERAIEIVGDDWSNLLDANPDARPLSISLGEFESPFEVSFRLVADSDPDVDWSETTVTLETTVGRGSLRVRQQVDASGSFSLPVVPGVHALEVRTPQGMPVASARISDLEIAANSASFASITLALRRQVRGTVRSPDGQPLDNAQLSFVPENDAESLADAFNVVTDENGEYTAWLDDTDYQVTVTGPHPSLPRRVVEWNAGDGGPLDVALHEPVVVFGRVVATPDDGATETWREIGDCVVRAFERGEEGELIVLGEGKTDDDGRFRIVLPARP